MLTGPGADAPLTPADREPVRVVATLPVYAAIAEAIGGPEVQTLAIADMDETAQAAARREFEARWNASNTTRTVLACLVSVLLLVVLLRL